MGNHDDKTAIIFLAMGGPSSTADVRKFLYNIFSDRAIIRLPGGPLLQKPLASLISRLREKKVQKNYATIGGSSPLLEWTNTQAKLVEERLQKESYNVSCYVGMRYFHPFVQEAVTKTRKDGCTKVIFMPMYPQYCRATTGSSFTEVKNAISKEQFGSVVYVDDFHDNDQYISLLKRYISENIADDEFLLFSAHSIPIKFVEDGDPYVDQTRRTAKLAAGDREYQVSFQSRTGPVEWVGPDTVDEVNRMAESEKKKLFIVPISFVCDHIETLYELDIELKHKLSSDGDARVRRMPMFNGDPEFAEVICEVLKKGAL